MNYLGVDYGQKKIGLALSTGSIATPLRVLTVKGLDDALAQVKRAIQENQIERVVVGMPESGQSHRLAKKFINHLIGTIPTCEMDENLSSLQARQEMADLGLPKKNRRQDDAYAAAVILQSFLDSKR